jgi:hypothetical protein
VRERERERERERPAIIRSSNSKNNLRFKKNIYILQKLNKIFLIK